MLIIIWAKYLGHIECILQGCKSFLIIISNFIVMLNSPSLISRLLFGCTALAIASAPCSKAMTKAYDCFDRKTGELSAQSNIDISSVALQCVINQDVEELLSQNSSPESEDLEAFVTKVDDIDDSLDFDDYDDDPQYEQELGEYDDSNSEDYESNESTGQQLGNAVGKHLGNLFGNLLNDMMK